MAVRLTKGGLQSVPDKIKKKGSGEKKPEVFAGPIRPTDDEAVFRNTGKTVKKSAPVPIRDTELSKKVAEVMATLPSNEKTTGFTQDMLDEARSQGIDVFDPHNLKKISKIEQGAQTNLSAQEQAIAAFLRGEQPDIKDLQQPILTPERMQELAAGKAIPTTTELVGQILKPTPQLPIGKDVASIIDLVRVGFSGKKPLGIQQAEASLTDAMAEISKQIDLAKAGRIQGRDVKTSIILAQNALSRLDEASKSFNSINLRYWIDEGAEIQSEIILKKQQLEDMQFELLQAIAQGAII